VKNSSQVGQIMTRLRRVKDVYSVTRKIGGTGKGGE